MKEVTTFDVYIDEESELGVDKISLVKKPAILTDFIYLSEEEQHDSYKQVFLSEDRRIITGPVLIPNLEILRKDDDGEPYYIKYNEEQIEKITQKFFKAKDQFSVNKDHKTDVNNVYIYESWIVGQNDKSKDLGFDLPQGTWMISMKVDDDEIWDGVKSGKYKGFSIEGLFKFKRSSKLIKQKKWSKRDIKSSNVDRVLFNDENNQLVVQFNDGSKYTYFDVNFSEFISVIDGLAECKTEGKNKWGEWYVGKSPSVGAAVWEYLINTGKSYTKGATFQEEVVLDHNELNLQKDTKNKNVNMVSAILKDGSTLYTDAESIQVGVDVYFMNGEEKVKPEAGEYVLEDGSTILVDESGKIADIKSNESENLQSENQKENEQKETKMELDPMLAEQFEALKVMIENLNLKIDSLIGSQMSQVKQSIENLEVKLEKLTVEAEMKLVDTVDSKNKINQSDIENKKRTLDYNLITKMNKKF
jgi:hypothetical protein